MNRCLLIALCALLTACTGTKFGMPKPSAPPPAPPAKVVAPTPPPPTMAPALLPPPTPSNALAEGIGFYEKGDYNGAIKRLTIANVPTAPKATQLSALKYMAFSYCLSSRQALCRQQFDKALKLDPTFDLEPGEKGHPLWGPVFVKAKKAKG